MKEMLIVEASIYFLFLFLVLSLLNNIYSTEDVDTFNKVFTVGFFIICGAYLFGFIKPLVILQFKNFIFLDGDSITFLIPNNISGNRVEQTPMPLIGNFLRLEKNKDISCGYSVVLNVSGEEVVVPATDVKGLNY